MAPIRFLAVHLVSAGIDPRHCHVFLGGRSRQDLLCVDEFKGLGMPVAMTTDDGSAGRQCLITDPLEEAIRANPPRQLYACGPHGMLQCIVGIAQRHGVPCQISLETMMACGMGACLGCAVPESDARQAYRHVCVDGPVFDSNQVSI